VYELLDPRGVVVDAGARTGSPTSIRFTDLEPNTAYVFLLTGVCAAGEGLQTATPAVTAPPPYLGPTVNRTLTPLLDTAPGLAPASAADTFEVSLVYTDYRCVKDIVVVSTEVYVDGILFPWAGTNTKTSDSPVTWVLTDVPYDSNLQIILQGTPDESLTGCKYLPDPDVPVSRTLSVDIPVGPPLNTCSVNTLVSNVQVVNAGVTCLTFSWDESVDFVNGYVYTLETLGVSDTRSALITNSNVTTVTESELAPGTNYVFLIAGRCADVTTIGAFTAVNVSTLPAQQSVLPAFVATPASLTFATVRTTPTTLYNATINYSGYLNVSVPILSFTGVPPSNSSIGVNSGTQWVVSNIPAGRTVNLLFTASPQDAPCPAYGTALTRAFTITAPSPAPPANPCINQTLALQVGTVTATCLTFSWTPPTVSSFPGGYAYQLLNGTNVVMSGPLAPTALDVPFQGLSPNTPYTFKLRGVCSATAATPWMSIVATTLNNEEMPTLGQLTQSTSNTTISYNPDDTVTVKIIYPTSLQTCVTDLVLNWNQSPPSGAVITPQPNTTAWTITSLPTPVSSPETFSFRMTASAADSSACSSCGPGPVTPMDFDILVKPKAPPVPPTPTTEPPFNLAITHYSGPPKRVFDAGKNITAPTAPPTASFDELMAIFAAGDASVQGSWKNQQSFQIAYAFQIVTNFVQFHLNQELTIKHAAGGETTLSYLPISIIYFGNSPDPALQGLSNPALDRYNVWEATLGFNFSCSVSTINSDLPLVNQPPGRYSFQYAPFLEFFVNQMIYNWEAQNGNHRQARQVELAFTNYGSEKSGEEWWFLTNFATTGTALPNFPVNTIITNQPTNPKTLPSVVTGEANDGNGSSRGTGAGWNCMERWFMHVAYTNQQLRKIIVAGGIKGTVGTAMQLSDLTSTNASFYQVAAITFDSEANGFSNTQTNSGTPYENNLTIKTLWNKWVNQSTAVKYPTGKPTTPPSWWSEDADMVAPAARPDAPDVFLPCRFSETTPGLIKNMRYSDLGSADYDAVSNIFHEIYDTSDSTPFYCLGAETTPVSCCSANGALTSGARFDAKLKAIANPTTATDPFAIAPETYSGQYGCWDLLIPAGDYCKTQKEPALDIDVDGNLFINKTITGMQTAFNGTKVTSAPVAVSPLLNTSVYTPWNKNAALLWTVAAYGTKGISPDAQSLGWALEASRYDLYNGAWASAAAAVNGKAVDYSAASVMQGFNGADGALMVSDLSTGLKPRVASLMKDITNATMAAGQVWMLSVEAGPFVNNKGVRGTTRQTDTPPSALVSDDYLTFSCPDSALDSTDPWPGWKGMQNQYYGPGTKAQNANVLQAWALNQCQLGLYDPAIVDGVYVVPAADSSEDNFGVFADFNIMAAAWLELANDLNGNGLNPNGITSSVGCFKYTPSTKPLLGCYELGYLPISWFGNAAPDWNAMD
jgi:hypothetical protein